MTQSLKFTLVHGQSTQIDATDCHKQQTLIDLPFSGFELCLLDRCQPACQQNTQDLDDKCCQPNPLDDGQVLLNKLLDLQHFLACVIADTLRYGTSWTHKTALALHKSLHIMRSVGCKQHAPVTHTSRGRRLPWQPRQYHHVATSSSNFDQQSSQPTAHIVPAASL